MSGIRHHDHCMTNWKTFEDEAPDMAAKVGARLRAHKHHVMATLRADGSPRVSGTEVELFEGEAYIGSMWQARKARDLMRDGRVAVHSNPGEETMEGGDAKFSASATEVPDGHPAKERIRDVLGPPEPFPFFRLDLHDVVLTEIRPEEDALLVHLWRPGREVTTTRLR
jgi:hypothetical protein